jgi:hypothetical protein
MLIGLCKKILFSNNNSQRQGLRPDYVVGEFDGSELDPEEAWYPSNQKLIPISDADLFCEQKCCKVTIPLYYACIIQRVSHARYYAPHIPLLTNVRYAPRGGVFPARECHAKAHIFMHILNNIDTKQHHQPSSINHFPPPFISERH